MIPLLIYTLGGPLAWLGLLVLFLLGRNKMMRLKRKQYSLPENPPRVTVIVPAKDEGAGIRACIERVVALDYPRPDALDVVAVDDRSTDQTGQILDDLAAKLPQRLRVIHIVPKALPAGWLGKCNALHIGTRAARGEWFLFVDSDVQVEPSALRAALALAIHRKYDALTILTRLQCTGFIEHLMLPLCAGLWATMFRISMTNDDNAEQAAANGQFFLIRRSAYEIVGGHEAVRDRIVEDVELMRLLKSRGFRTRFMLGNHLASTRMHSNLKQMFHGWGRIYSGTARRHPLPLILSILFLIGSGLSLYPAMAFGLFDAVAHRDYRWLLVALMHWGMMSVLLTVVYRGSGNRSRYAQLFPISASLLVGILAYSIRLCRTGQVTWRGTKFRSAAPTR